MKTLTISNQEFLLKLSRKCLEYYFRFKKEYPLDEDSIPSTLKENLATFVTLTINNELRGCIGKLEADQPLFKDVKENTYFAAFNDWRFSPLTKDELEEVKIEISVLSIPEPLNYSDSTDLIKKISASKPGLIIKSGYSQATFLPQVWEDLPTPELFLSELCEKANLSPDFWRDNPLEVSTYNVFHFKEK